MRKRSHFDQITMDVVEERLKEICWVVEQVKAGQETFVSAAQKLEINYGIMRRIFYSLEHITELNSIEHSIEERENQNATTPIEQFYAEVFQYSPASNILADIMPPDAYDTVRYLCEHPTEFHLGEREGKLLYLYYIEGLTLAQTGEKLGISRERVRQILHRSINVMRYPIRAKYLELGLSAYQACSSDWEKRKEELRQEYMDLLEKKDQEISQIKRQLSIKEDEKEKLQDVVENGSDIIIAKFGSIPVSGLGLSNRSVHALQFAGIDTFGELLRMDRKQIKNIRNIGKKSVLEIEAKLRQYDPKWK